MPPPSPAPRRSARRAILWVLAAVAALALVTGLVRMALLRMRHMRMGALATFLAPPDKLREVATLPNVDAGQVVRPLRKQYPRDPRVLLLAAQSAATPAESEALLRAGLAEREILEAFFGDGRVEVQLRVELARSLLSRGAEPEASVVVRPACARIRELAPGALPPELLRDACR